MAGEAGSDSDSDAEKKHAPTRRRLDQAREKGQIKRSNDLPKAAATLFLILIVAGLGGLMMRLGSVWLTTSLDLAGTLSMQRAAALDARFAMVVSGFLLVVGILSFASGIASGGWMMSLGLLMPKAERVDPAKAWGQMFSVQNAIEIGKSLLKVVVIGGAAFLAYRTQRLGFLSLSSPRQITIGALAGPAFVVIAAAAGGAGLLGAVDVGTQIWLNRRSLRMTDKEMRDEMKETDGDPHTKARRRSTMRRMATARQKQAVKTASVVVTNPTHVAVAVRYRRGQDAVPFVVAKGADLVAADLLAEARRYGVPLAEAPPLARALSRLVDIDQPIPGTLYRAVAEILAYVWRLETWKKAGGARPSRPVFPESLDDTGRAD